MAAASWTKARGKTKPVSTGGDDPRAIFTVSTEGNRCQKHLGSLFTVGAIERQSAGTVSRVRSWVRRTAVRTRASEGGLDLMSGILFLGALGY